MNISLESKSPVSSVITMNIEKGDYEKGVKKAINTFCSKAQVPGFRQGKIPFGVGKKMYGEQAKMEEINKVISDNLSSFIEKEQLEVLGSPLPIEDQEALDIANEENYVFKFEVALRPKVEVSLDKDDKIPYYNIEVSDDQVEKEIEELAQRAGAPQPVDSYEDKDILRGILAELDENGQPLEGGLTIDSASLMPTYMHNEEQKELFKGAKTNDVIVFTPSEAMGEAEVASILKLSKEEAAKHKGKFSFQVNEVSRFMPAQINQELFDQVFGKDEVKTEEEFKSKVKETIQERSKGDSDYRFFIDLQEYTTKKAGNIDVDTEILKRIAKNNQQDEKDEFNEEGFETALKSLKWQIIVEKLLKDKDVKITEEDIKKMAVDAARYQFAQYGMGNVPEEYIEQYAQKMLSDQANASSIIDRCADSKFADTYKEVVTLEKKTITTEEFKKLFESEEAK